MLTGERPSPGEPPRTLPSDAHRELADRHDALVARFTATEPADRPADAFEARGLLLTLPWPATVDAGAARPRSERRSSVSPAGGRLEARLDGAVVDGWTGRAVERVPLSDVALDRARAFARVDHPALQTVLRVDCDDGAIWLEALPGRRLDRALTRAERSSLDAALEALHAEGVVHGRVDPDHVVVGESGAVLRFEGEHDATATVDRDRLGLSRLSAE